MDFILSFCISIIVASGNIVIVNSTPVNHSTQNCTFCSTICKPHGSSENDIVKVFKATDRGNTIFCLSNYKMKWFLAQESNDAGQPLFSRTNFNLEQWTHNDTDNKTLFCLGLTVPQFEPSWDLTPVYAMCKGTAAEESSRWYKLHANFTVQDREVQPDASTLRNFTVNVSIPSTTPAPTTLSPSAQSLPAQAKETASVAPVASTPNQTNESTVDYNNNTQSKKESSGEIEIQNSIHPTEIFITKPNVFPNSTGSETLSITSQSGQSSGVGPQAADSTNYIIYGVGGGAAASVLLLLTLVVILMNKVKKQRQQLEMTNEEIDEFMLGIAAEKANAKGINGLFILPYDTKLEIPKSDVTIRSAILGSGAFGQVVKGTYKGNPVAIKMLKNNASQSAEYLRSLLGELKVMSYLGSHPNLVGLIGAMTANIKRGEVHLIFEYCSKGNAHKFVRDRRDNFVDLLAGPAPSEGLSVKHAARVSRISKFYGTIRGGVSLTTKDLVRWAYEVACGMEFVSSKNVYHGDLAARNILLMEDLTAKVGDFGLSKQLDMEKYNCYVQKKECPLPLKWMAIESLRDLTFSIQSDVWSYGVTLWELFTLGATPYPGMDWNFESWKLLCEGKRLGKPDYASDSIYDIMMKCWNADPKSRPRFEQLKAWLYLELNKL